MTHTGKGRILEEVAGAGGAFGIGRLQDGELIAAVGLDEAGDAGGPVGAVGLELTSAQSLLQRLTALHEVADGIGLVTVGNDEAATDLTDGMIDDQAGIGQLGGIESLGTDAVVLLDTVG